MKKPILLVASILFLTGLAACSHNNDKNTSNGQPEMLNVELSIKPESGEVNQPITFESKVTQGHEKVKDADEVVFEIWRSKDQNHEMIKIKHFDNGIYRLEKSFQKEGTYYIVSHVTARNMHNMPKKEFTVGAPSEPEDTTSKDSMENMNKDNQKDNSVEEQ